MTHCLCLSKIVMLMLPPNCKVQITVDASSVDSKAMKIVCYSCEEPGHERPSYLLNKKKVMKR